jgi:hypothetical protein
MSSYEFKDFVVNLFKRLGYSNIKVGSETPIRGVDMTMEKATDIGGAVRYLVQCEHQPLGVVGLSVVKILHSTVVSTPTLDKGLIVASGRFSSEAIEYAEDIGIELIDAWKLIELGKRVGLTIQKKPSQQLESCFPISNKSQITLRALNFLKNNLIGFEEKSANIEEIGLRLIPSYMVDYSISATFSTSVGVIHSINERSSVFLSNRGELLHFIITNPLLSQKYRISTVTPDALGDVKIFEKGEFTRPFKEIKNTAKDVLTRIHTKTVVYYGANNRRYEKTCIPKQKDINILDAKRVYIPFWDIVFSILKNKYAIVGVESSSGLTVLPSNMVSIKTDSGVKVYPNMCMMCSKDMKDQKFVCTECGMIACSKDSFKCKQCGRQICREHTSFRRKFLILSEKYCPQCALSKIGK